MKGSEGKKTKFDEKIILSRKKSVLRIFSQINPKILEDVDFTNDNIDSPAVLICLNEVKNRYKKNLHKKAISQMHDIEIEDIETKLKDLEKRKLYNINN